MIYAISPTPLGKVTICSDGHAITGLHLEGDRYFSNIPDSWTQDTVSPLLKQAGKELEEYFQRQKKTFDLPISAAGTTFQKAVWDAISQIPYGKTASYSEIATKIGKPKSARAVASAIGRNPICLVVPCHRIIASDGGLGGYIAGLNVKKKLLELED